MRRAASETAVRAPQWVQGVDGPDAWAEEHRWLLEAAFASFDRTGEWPRIEEVQQDLAGEPERAVAVGQLLVEIPPGLGARFSQHVQLTVRALAHVPAAASLIELFVRAMQVAVVRYPGKRGTPPVIRGTDIQAHLELDETTFKKVLTLLESESWFFGSGGTDGDGDWYRDIRAEILCLRGVSDIQSYLNAVARYRFGPAEIVVAAPPAERFSLIRRPRRWLAKREVSVFDLLAIGVVSGVIVGVIIWLLTG
jgi:hypothetical protein